MFKPLLAPNTDPMRDPQFFNKLVFPLIGSPKLDGIRMNVRGGRCLSRTLKDLPNHALEAAFGHFENLDGELVHGNPTDPDVYNRTQSIVMSHEKPIEGLAFHVFDLNEDSWAVATFEERFRMAMQTVMQHQANGTPGVMLVPHMILNDMAELLAFESEMLKQGYEGIMLRDPKGPYKHGRSTFNQGILIKLKRFKDEEAIVIGFKEAMLNKNVAFENETGNTARSTRKEGLVAANTTGKIVVDFGGQELDVSCGTMKHDERKEVWDNQDAYIGRHITFRHFAHGAKDKPRFPRFVGWRDMDHM